MKVVYNGQFIAAINGQLINGQSEFQRGDPLGKKFRNFNFSVSRIGLLKNDLLVHLDQGKQKKFTKIQNFFLFFFGHKGPPFESNRKLLTVI